MHRYIYSYLSSTFQYPFMSETLYSTRSPPSSILLFSPCISSFRHITPFFFLLLLFFFLLVSPLPPLLPEIFVVVLLLLAHLIQSNLSRPFHLSYPRTRSVHMHIYLHPSPTFSTALFILLSFFVSFFVSFFFCSRSLPPPLRSITKIPHSPSSAYPLSPVFSLA